MFMRNGAKPDDIIKAAEII